MNPLAGLGAATFDQSDHNQSLIKKLQNQIRDLEQNLALNKEILNKIMTGNDANQSLVQMIKDLQTKNSGLTNQIQTLSFEKESVQTFANQQVSELMAQIKQLQESTLNDQEKTKEQIQQLQIKLAEKESQFIKLDKEYKKKKKEYEKLENKIIKQHAKDLETPSLTQGMSSKVNQSFDVRNLNKDNSIDFEELMHTSIDMITQKIQNKHQKRSTERSPSVPKLNFQAMKEFQEQDWLSYSQKLQDSIKVLNKRIAILQDENDQVTQKYHKLAQQNTKLYELNERLNLAMKQMKSKMEEMKNRYKDKMKQTRQECSFCNNMVEMNLQNFTMTYDKVNFMNDIDNSKLDLTQQEVNQDSFVGKPKILKDSSKYIKKKNIKSSGSTTPNQSQLQQPGQNPQLPITIMQQVQEGLSQILNPSQTFYSQTSQNTSTNQGAPTIDNQTPTFTNQHMPKIFSKEVGSASNKMSKMQQHFMKQDLSRNQEVNDTEEIKQQKIKQQQLQEQFMKNYVSPQISNPKSQNLDKSKQSSNPPSRSSSDAKTPPPGGLSKPISGQKSQQNSKERLKHIVIGDDIIKIKRINKDKKKAQTNRNSPTNAGTGSNNGSSSHHSNIIGNIMNVFERKKRNQ